MFSSRRIIVSFLLATLLLVTSCAQEAPSRFEQAQQESTQGSQRNQAVSKDAVKGGSLNKFFPSDGDGYDVVYTQEKLGFAQAKLKKDGQELAVLSISDTLSNPGALDKFKTTTDKIKGYPAIKQGNNSTAVLVKERFQVKAVSRDQSFTDSDRQKWLEKFDLNGLAQQQ
jgi:hypothetical protein